MPRQKKKSLFFCLKKMIYFFFLQFFSMQRSAKRQCMRTNELIKCPDDILKSVLLFLCYIDSKALVFALPTMNVMAKTLIQTKLHDSIAKKLLLLEISGDAKRFLTIVNSSDAFITGSFLLSCMYEETWERVNDIDVVVQSKMLPFVHDQFDRVCTQHTDTFLDNLIASFIDGNFKNYVIRIKNQINANFSVSKYLPSKYKLQHPSHKLYSHNEPMVPFLYDKIKMDSKDIINRIACFVNPLDFIATYFDASFCKVAFSKNKLHVFDWNSLFSRTSQLNMEAHFDAIHDGFLFQDEKDYPDIKQQPECNFVKSMKEFHCAKLFLRQRKYFNRGFKIHFMTEVPLTTMNELRLRLSTFFPKEMQFLEVLHAYKETGNCTCPLPMIEGEVASRFAKLLGFMNFPSFEFLN